MRKLSGNVMYAPNVADTELFASALDPGALDPGMASLAAPQDARALTSTNASVVPRAAIISISPNFER